MCLFSRIRPLFTMAKGTMENPGRWCPPLMKEVASEGFRGYEPSHFLREVVNFHSLLDHLADISIPSLCLYRVFIALMALRWLNSLGLLNFYLLLRNINHLDTRLANGGEINGSVISPAVELSLSKARLSQVELSMFRGKCRGVKERCEE